MKSSSFAKAITLGCLMCLALPVACGDDESSPNPSPGAGGSDAGAPSTTPTAGTPGNMGDAGAGGAPAPMTIPGTSTTSMSKTCGGTKCDSTKTLLPTLFIDPCCAADDSCGVSTAFLVLLQAQFKDVCQPKAQPGEPDAACPASADQMLPYNGAQVPVPGFAGCCRADTGTCGVVIDKIPTGIGNFSSPGLGCVDSAPFFKGKAGAACGAGGSGAGGAGGMSTGGVGGAG